MDIPGLKETIDKKSFLQFFVHTEIHQLTPDKEFTYPVMHIPHFAVIIPKKNDKYLLIRQYRPSWRQIALEFPAGVADSFEEDPLETAKRELQEETGYLANKLTLIAKNRHSSRTTQWAFMYLAEDLEESKTNFDEGELIVEKIWMTKEEVLSAISSGEILDISHVFSFLRLFQ